MSTGKTLSFQLLGVLATKNNRRNVADIRGAYAVDEYNEAEYMLAFNTHRDLGAIEAFVMLATDGDHIQVTFTTDTETITVPLVQLAFMSGPFENVRISNTATSGDPSKVRVNTGS